MNVCKMSDLAKQFSERMTKLQLPVETGTFLLCVSGGIDSIAMISLFTRAGYSTAIAHVNYGYRGVESDEDEALVRQVAARSGLRCFVLDASGLPSLKGESLQMTARRIRYQWFGQLLREQDFAFAATAHHADDALETFFINVNRGAGGKGSSGLSYKREQFIKPLLAFSRKEIQSYATENQLVWREDASNKKDVYLRNRIRHKIIPALNEVFPDFSKKIQETFKRQKRERKLLDYFLEETAKQVKKEVPQGFEISIASILQFPDPAIILFELIRAYGFKMHECEQICQKLTNPSGQRYLSGDWQLCIEGRRVLIFNTLNQILTQTPELEVTELAEPPDFTKEIPSNIAYLDGDLCKEKLQIRKWRNADYFRPSGMNGKKLLSDFLREQKVPFPDRQNQYVVTCGEAIVWVVNHRIDGRFAANSCTKKVLMLRLC